MSRYQTYFTTLIIIIVISCSKDAMDLFSGFKTPTHFPATSYPLNSNRVSKAGFELGKTLFYDSTLSIDNSISCASCHMQASAFTHHGHSLSHGLNNGLTLRNAPPIMNLAWSSSFMWDGSINQLDRQPINPLTSPIEMGETIPNVISKINGSSMYLSMFKSAFGKPTATEETFLKALSQFMLMCISADSKYDSVKRGQSTFTSEENKGYNVFILKCNSCHKEPLFTDHSFRNTGLPPNELTDSGRYVFTKNMNDLYKFKVPSLRNLSYTKPYMHDGRFGSIDKVLLHYSNNMSSLYTLDPIFKQGSTIGIPLSTEEKTNLKAFLLTLDDNHFVTNPLFEKGMSH